MIIRGKTEVKSLIEFVWYKYIGAIFRILPIKRGRIVFSNFYGRGFADNPKYIAQEYIKRNSENIQLVWLIKGKRKSSIPKEIKQVRRGTILELYYLYTANVWIDNCRKHFGIVKRKGQFYVQTWHAGIGLKKCEKDISDTFNKTYLKSAINDSKMADLFLSNSKWETDLYKNCFWYDGKILEVGLPREDILYEKKGDCYKKVCEKFGIELGTNIVVYAPTFRDSGDCSSYNVDYNRVIKALKKRFKNSNWVILLRYHPNVKMNDNDNKKGFNIINTTEYPDINDLILASELLITDYSCCMFDGLLANKKVILYASDLDRFKKNGRGILFTINELPFSIATNNDELEMKILEFSNTRYSSDRLKFFEKCGIVFDGTATEKVVDYINKTYIKKEKK